jgi:hypothetical protein
MSRLFQIERKSKVDSCSKSMTALESKLEILHLSIRAQAHTFAAVAINRAPSPSRVLLSILSHPRKLIYSSLVPFPRMV